MITLNSLVQKLGYDVSPYYCRVNAPHPSGSAHLFRSAKSLGADGLYVFEKAPKSSKSHHTPAPAVYVAEAADEIEARQIHRKLWNLCSAPFAIILLPNQVRVYTGFNYKEENENEGLLDVFNSLEQLNQLVKEFNANAIDTGKVWQSQYAEQLDSNRRVDRLLLENIKQLGEALTRNDALKDELANMLIGKYVYLKYLRDRGILTNQWMEANNLSPDGVFSLNATVSELRKLSQALEERFNGKIFPINFDTEETLKDEHVKWVATIFSGAEIVDRGTTPDIVLQLHLPFKAYDFEYIPVETLSSIYEQFIFDRKTKGAVYTPEALADYLIAEMESVLPLKGGMKILDPACGSGIFLVLIYRLLIEKEIQRRGKKLNAKELLDILKESIYGVEREPDACYVAEFSLILTLLHYLEPRELQNLDFRFPTLHNRQVFETDFFDTKGNESESEFWKKDARYDWIIGNPPWINLNSDVKKKENKFAYAWMENPDNKSIRPVGKNQIAEAFCWLASDLLCEGGVSGFIIPATSFFNQKHDKFRKLFFSKHEILRVTNFSNIPTIFGERDNEGKKSLMKYPPATIMFRNTSRDKRKQRTLHFGPFSINQLFEARDKPWVIIVNENEISSISPGEVEAGKTLAWKLALWGNHVDRRILERIKHAFPKTLKDRCKNRKVFFFEGPQLRCNDRTLKHLPTLIGKKKLNTASMRKSLSWFSIPSEALPLIGEECCYVRRGENTGLKLTTAPHIVIPYRWMSFIIYSDEDFVIPPRYIGIASANKDDARYLQAISVYLKSYLVAYYLFFQTPQWGVFKEDGNQINLKDVREIPVPDFTSNQISTLAHLQEELVAIEREEICKLISGLKKNRLLAARVKSTNGDDDTGVPANLRGAEKEIIKREKTRIRKELQERIDNTMYEMLSIPRDIRLVIDDFFKFRLPLDSPSQKESATRRPTAEELQQYAFEIGKKLDDFLDGESFVRVTIFYSNDLIEAVIDVTGAGGPFPVDPGCVKQGNKTRTGLLTELSGSLRRQVSQWVYIQRGLRLFDGPRIHIFKTPRIIDWTRTQARIDAGDIIGELVQGNDG